MLLISTFTGILIGIAGLAYLSTTPAILGSLLFSFGLSIILVQNLYLYTGKIGKFKNKKDIPMMATILIGNFIGAYGFGIILFLFGFSYLAIPIVVTKTSISILLSFFCSICCGIILELAVSSYKETNNIFLVILCVMVFITCGFEHSIANMFFFALSGQPHFGYLAVNILGNSLGAIGTHKFVK